MDRCGARTFLLVPVWIVATLGFFGFTSWVPTLLLAHGFSLINSLAWSSTMSLAILPGALIAALAADRMDRKWSIALDICHCFVWPILRPDISRCDDYRLWLSCGDADSLIHALNVCIHCRIIPI